MPGLRYTGPYRRAAEALFKAQRLIPQLTDEGFGFRDHPDWPPRNVPLVSDLLRRAREEQWQALREIDPVIDFVSRRVILKSPTKKLTSREWTKIVNKWHLSMYGVEGRISNGSVIAAAVGSGVPWAPIELREDQFSVSVYLGLSVAGLELG